MVRKVTKTKGAFPSEEAILKQIYLATINANAKWQGEMFAVSCSFLLCSRLGPKQSLLRRLAVAWSFLRRRLAVVWPSLLRRFSVVFSSVFRLLFVFASFHVRS